MASNSAEGIRWDLTDLFSSYDDPRIQVTLDDCKVRAENFYSRFKGKIKDLAAEKLFEGLRELEEIEEALSRVGSYASLLYAADSLRPEYQDLEQKVEQRVTEIRNLLLFFELEWLELDEQTAERSIHDPVLKTYSHYLKNLRRLGLTGFRSRRKESSMKRTTRAAMLSAASSPK